MTILNEANNELIDVYGEVITVVPSTHPTMDSDDIWPSTNDFDEAASFETTARVLRTARALEQMQSGLSDEADSAVYFKEEKVSTGDKIIIDDREWVVTSAEVSRLGNGAYRQVAPITSLDK